MGKSAQVIGINPTMASQFLNQRTQNLRSSVRPNIHPGSIQRSPPRSIRANEISSKKTKLLLDRPLKVPGDSTIASALRLVASLTSPHSMQRDKFEQ